MTNPNLLAINLENNSFTGTLPTGIGQLQRLSDLRLSSNNLGASIPTELFQLSALTQFFADSCNLQGTLSEDFSLLNGTLRNLVVSNNNLSGPIPAAFDQLTNLGKSPTQVAVFRGFTTGH